MANLTLNKPDTALVLAGDTQATTDKGDMFIAMWPYMDAATYNPIRSAYISLKAQIHTTIQNGFTVTGINEDDTERPIGDLPPSRPPAK